MKENQSKIIRLCRMSKGGFSLDLQNENDTFSTVQYDAYCYELADIEFQGTD